VRLVPKVDGVIDRFDRAFLLTIPFDLAFETLALVIPRPRLIQTVPRIDQSVFCESRIALREVVIGPRVGGDVFVE